MLCLSSSFGVVGVESRDFSQAEKERTACKAKQIHYFHSKRQPRTIVSLISFASREKSRDSTSNSQTLEDM